MKKCMKFISGVLSLLLILSSMTAFATGNDPRLTIGNTTDYDLNIGIAPEQAAKSETVVSAMYKATNSTCDVLGSSSYYVTSRKDSYVGVLKFKLPDLGNGKTLDKCIVRFAASWNGAWTVAKIPGDQFNMSDLRRADIIENESANGGATPVQLYYDSENPISKAVNVAAYIMMTDITDYAKECIEAGQSYMYLSIYCPYSKDLWANGSVGATRDAAGFNYKDFFPYIYYTEKDADPLTLVSSTPENGAENIGPDTPVSFVFNNALKSADVTLNGEAVSAETDGSTVTVDESLKQYMDYVAVVKATDVYGQTAENTIYFSTGAVFAASMVRDGAESWYVTASADPTKPDAKKTAKGGANQAWVFKLPLNTDGKLYDSYKFTSLPDTQNEHGRLLKMPGTDWDMSTLRFSSDASTDFGAIYSNADTYRLNVVGKTSWEENKIYVFYPQTTDITAYANECVANGQDCMYLMQYNIATVDYAGFDYANASRRPYFSYSLIEPELRALSSEVDVSGSTLKSLSINLLTSGSEIAEGIALRNKDTGAIVEDATFTFDVGTRTANLADFVALEESTEYEVVILSGISDDFGNVLSEDLVVTKFVTSKNILVAQSKIVLSSEEVTDFDAVENVTNLDRAESYKAVTKISNNSSEDIDIVLFIAKYDSENLMSDITVKPVTIDANAQDVIIESNELSLGGSGSFVKAFVWNADNQKPLITLTNSQVSTQ